MKHALLIPLLSLCMFNVNSLKTDVTKNMVAAHTAFYAGNNFRSLNIGNQAEPGTAKMSAVEFRAQKYCYTELKDFDFDAHFSVVSATVYFSGTNFKNVEQGKLTSESFKPISDLVARCVPGSIIIFDAVTVVGPDKTPRRIAGLTIMLY